MRHSFSAALLGATLLAAPTAARAHAILMSSDPVAGSTVKPGQRKLVLRYNSRIDHARSRLTLEGTNAQMTLALDKDSAPDALASQGDFTPGTYVIHWQVLAVDGHMTRGDVRFTVAP